MSDEEVVPKEKNFQPVCELLSFFPKLPLETTKIQIYF